MLEDQLIDSLQKYGRGSQWLRIINVKYRLEGKNTLFSIFCCAVCPCEYTEAGSLLTPCTKCSHLPQWHWPLAHAHTHTCARMQRCWCRRWLCKGTALSHQWNQNPRNGSTVNALALLMANESSSAVQTKWKLALYQKPYSLSKKSGVSFSGERTSSIMCWCIGNVVYFNSLVF